MILTILVILLVLALLGGSFNVLAWGISGSAAAIIVVIVLIILFTSRR